MTRNHPMGVLLTMCHLTAAINLLALAAALVAAGTPTAGTRPQNAQAPPSFVLTGRLVDAVTGEPIGSALVTLAPAAAAGRGTPGARGAGAAPGERVFTNADGRFVFHSMLAGSYALTASQSDYFPAAFGQTRPQGPSRRFELGGGDRVSNVTLRMWKEGHLSGTIRGEDGEPMPDVRVEAVELSGSAERRQFAVRWTAVTDDRGVYRLSALQPGDVLLRVGQLTTSIPAETAIAFLDEMGSRSGNAISDSVRGSGGAPTTTGHRIDDQLVQIGRVGFPRPGVAASVSVQAGKMTVYSTTFFPGVPTVAAARIVTLPPGVGRDGLDMTLRPVPAYRVSGRVTGGPGSYVTVKITPVGPEGRIAATPSGGEIAQAITRTDGSFTAIGVPAGQYTVTVTRPAATSGVDGPPVSDLRLWWASAPLVVGNADVRDVMVQLTPGATVSGRVEFEPGTTAQPPAASLERARVALRPVVAMREVRGSAPLGASGTFTSGEVPPGQYTLSVSLPAPGWTLKSVTVGGRDRSGEPLDVPASGLANVVVTYTDAAGELSGTVTASAGGDAARVYLVPLDARGPSSPRPHLLRSIDAAAGESYRFTAVLPGEYIVAAVSEDAALIESDDAARIAALVRAGTRITVAPRAKHVQSLQIVEVK